jgi:hypothetical protein
MYYILLEDKNAVVCGDLINWGQWFKKANRNVAVDTISEVKISTVFLGIDHAFQGSYPILFETMVFGGALDEEQERCSTWEQAEIMHQSMCERVRNSVSNATVRG